MVLENLSNHPNAVTDTETDADSKRLRIHLSIGPLWLGKDEKCWKLSEN